jgi:hypothetical protein
MVIVHANGSWGKAGGGGGGGVAYQVLDEVDGEWRHNSEEVFMVPRVLKLFSGITNSLDYPGKTAGDKHSSLFQ